MLREPGPIPPLDLSWYPTTYEVADFTAIVNSGLAEADGLFGQMDSLFDPAAAFDEALSGDTILADLDTVDQINGDSAHLANTSGIAVIDGYKADGDAGLTAAIQVIPGEAFSPVPAATQWATAAPSTVTASVASVTISDITHPGHSSFLVGDQFQILVQMDTSTGNVNDYFGVHVYATVTKDGIAQVNFEFDNTDHTGSTTRTSQFQSTDVGNWSMTVYAVPLTGGSVVSSPVSWVVTTADVARQGPTVAAVSVTVKNWTSGDITNNHSGDTWQVFVSGPPNQPVYLFAWQNGQALQEVTLGSTDSFGNFNLAGKWENTEIGDWVEHYAVGRYEMVGNLNFTIQPAG